jgi:hypothetical protein
MQVHCTPPPRHPWQLNAVLSYTDAACEVGFIPVQLYEGAPDGVAAVLVTRASSLGNPASPLLVELVEYLI